MGTTLQLKGNRTVLSYLSLLALFCAALVLAGCGEQTGGVVGEDPVRVLEVDSPLDSPVWGPNQQDVFALQQDGDRLVKIDVTIGGVEGENARPAVSLSEGLEGAGENLAADLVDEEVLYVPQPELDQVALIGGEDMNTVRTYIVSPGPEKVAVDTRVDLAVGANTLFALSTENSTVTGVNLEDGETVFQEDVESSEDTIIQAARVGGGREFWMAGPEGVAFYSVGEIRRPVDLDLSAVSLAVDPDNPGRAFVGDTTGRVTAVEAASALELDTGAEADLGDETVEVLAVEEGSLYAVVPGRLVVLDPESLEQRRVVEFATAGVDLGSAVPSGIAVGDRSVYVTLENQPYMIEIEKP